MRLHQVITNVLSNARKFTPAGGRITVELTARNGDAWLKVNDTGVGITPEDQPHIFERFSGVATWDERPAAASGWRWWPSSWKHTAAASPSIANLDPAHRCC